MEKLSAAVIGCGQIAGGVPGVSRAFPLNSHAGAYNANDDVFLQAAFDVDPQKLKVFCEAWNVPDSYDSLDALLTHKFDVVSICTPDSLHFEHAMRVIDSGCARAIWMEKPVCQSSEQAEKLIDGAERAGVSLYLSNQRRYEPAHIEIKEMLSTGALGPPVHARGMYVRGILHNGCTLINTLRFFLGEVDWVQAFEPFDSGSYGEERSLSALLGFSSGCVGAVFGSDTHGYGYSVFEIDISTREGRVRCHENGSLIEIFEARTDPDSPDLKDLVRVREVATDISSSLHGVLSNLVKDLLLPSVNPPVVDSVRQGATDIRIIEAIIQSAKHNGERIAVVR